jgi:hypothetical protein
VLDSYPPMCRGLPLANWHWDQVAGEQTARGATWGSYQVLGTYDGTTFTVVRAQPPAPAPNAPEQLTPPCPEPPGGWRVPDPARRTEAFLEPVRRAAGGAPGYAGMWLSYLTPMGQNVAVEPGEFVLNVAFTGDLARHEAELRRHWGGRLCVTHQERTQGRLLEIQRELGGQAATDLGLEVLSTGIVDPANAVELRVVSLDARTREALDARYGPGSVRVTAALTPA